MLGGRPTQSLVELLGNTSQPPANGSGRQRRHGPSRGRSTQRQQEETRPPQDIRIRRATRPIPEHRRHERRVAHRNRQARSSGTQRWMRNLPKRVDDSGSDHRDERNDVGSRVPMPSMVLIAQCPDERIRHNDERKCEHHECSTDQGSCSRTTSLASLQLSGRATPATRTPKCRYRALLEAIVTVPELVIGSALQSSRRRQDSR